MLVTKFKYIEKVLRVDNLLVRNIIIEDGTSTMKCSQMSIGFFQERVGGLPSEEK